MKIFTHIPFVLAFALVLAAGAWQGARLRHIREAEAFFRWVNAAAANERMGWSPVESEYRDGVLYERVKDAALPLLPEVAMPEPKEGEKALQMDLLSYLAGEEDYDHHVWAVLQGPELAPLRVDFLEYARDRKLQYAMGIDYAEAQASGVNIFNLFFGFRKVAANFIWIQVDRYWHQGMMHRMIPLMKTCVTLDPNFVDAYILGAWHLSYNATAKMLDTPQPLKQWNPKYQACVGEKETYYYLGIEFLQDGIRNNPRDYRLYFDLGFAIYKNKLFDYENAVKYLAMAIRQQHDRWVPRQLYICLELNGQYEEALAGWKDLAQRFQGTVSADETAPRFIQRNTGLIYERQAEQAREAAAKESDPQKAEALRAEADQYEQLARTTWTEMYDPYADYRLALMDAKLLAQQGRYLEATALLDKARWDYPSQFDDASDYIIDLKIKGGLPLTDSERKAVLRREEGDRCPGMPEPEALAVGGTTES
jgi:hypothetical protein